MGIFEKFKQIKKNRQIKSAEKCGQTLCNKVTTKDQRNEAIAHLISLPPDVAIPQLLKRFEMTVDHGIQDSREKEACLEFMVENQKVSKELVINAIEQKKKIAWPIKVAEKILTTEEFKLLLVSTLSTQTALFDDDEIEKNIDLLLALKEHPTELALNKIEKFLTVRNEPLKVAALECLEEHSKRYKPAKEILLSYANKIEASALEDGNARLSGLVSQIVSRVQNAASV
jgi:hypothetical protein